MDDSRTNGVAVEALSCTSVSTMRSPIGGRDQIEFQWCEALRSIIQRFARHANAVQGRDSCRSCEPVEPAGGRCVDPVVTRAGDYVLRLGAGEGRDPFFELQACESMHMIPPKVRNAIP